MTSAVGTDGPFASTGRAGGAVVTDRGVTGGGSTVSSGRDGEVGAGEPLGFVLGGGTTMVSPCGPIMVVGVAGLLENGFFDFELCEDDDEVEESDLLEEESEGPEEKSDAAWRIVSGPLPLWPAKARPPMINTTATPAEVMATVLL